MGWPGYRMAWYAQIYNCELDYIGLSPVVIQPFLDKPGHFMRYTDHFWTIPLAIHNLLIGTADTVKHEMILHGTHNTITPRQND